MKYRKKPIVIDAFQFDFAVEKHPEWFKEIKKGDILQYRDQFGNLDHIQIKTDTGFARCDIGDYLIKGVEGEVYPCSQSVFEKTYEAVDGEGL